LLESGSFDACKNAATPIIVMLGCLEINIKFLDTGIETTEFDDYREMLKDDRDANGMLTVI